MNAAGKTLCLNMIVKNEMANLPRCLGAVADHIGCWVIGDTGSSDGTQDFIRAFFAERDLPGELHSFPFVNFEQARNEALDRAYATKLAYDYLMFDDADMELVVEDPDFRTKLEAPGYQLIQRAGSGLAYWNARVARRDAGVRYHGVTHEYLDVPGGVQRLQGVWYKDHASGANRADKVGRDAMLLTEALKQDPDNHRYWFYLAQSYRDAGRTKEAADAYAKRAGMGGWDEEAWNARLQEARCLRALEDEGGFLRAALAAFNQRPQRAEPLHDLARYYRQHGMYDASMLFSEAGLALPQPRPDQDILFIEDFVYTAGMREEFSIAANYSRDPARKDRGHAACNWLALNRDVPQGSRDLARYNLLFYVEPAKALMPSFNARPVGFTPPDGFKAINPSIARRGEQIVMVQRTGNWTVTEDGQYRVPDGGPARTRNFLLRLNLYLEIESSIEIHPTDWPVPLYGHVLGFEDSRLFTWRDELWCSSTVRELNLDGLCQQILGRIDCQESGQCRLTNWRVLNPGEEVVRHEKNWMPRVASDALNFIYLCDPTRIVNEFGCCTAEAAAPIAAEQFRGGSQAIAFDGGWLALVHEVNSHGSKRYYQHRLVWFDAANVLRGVSRRFIFHQKGLEFAAGLAWHPDDRHLLISYGVGDREAWIATVDANEVRRTLEDAERLPSGTGRLGSLAMQQPVFAQRSTKQSATPTKEPNGNEHAINNALPLDSVNLSAIFLRWGTDKVTNGYADLYESLFRRTRHNIQTVLEIGIGTMILGVHSSMVGYAPASYKPGASLRSWREFFPNATIYGADVQSDTQFSDEERIQTFLCDSTNAGSINGMMRNIQHKNFDIIIDDGSHRLEDQLATLRNLFPLLADDGTYIVEDIIYGGLYHHTDDIRAICGNNPFFFSGPQNNPLVIVKRGPGNTGSADPESARHWFHLAASYFGAGRIKEAAEAYARRAGMGGWDEEVWYARLQEARCLRTLGDESGFLRAALAAFNHRPQRAEPLYDLARHYRERGMNDTSVLFSEPGLAIRWPSQDTLFLEDFVYTTGLREEYSIAANYALDKTRKERGHAMCEWLALSRGIPEHQRNVARRNLVFYARPLGELAPSFAAHRIAFDPPPGWSACNPGLARWGNDIWCVIRSGNHTLHDDGSFTAPPGEYVKTRNYLARLDDHLDPVSVDEISMPADWPVPLSPRAQGFEDCRLFVWQDHLWVSATISELTPQGRCEIALARIEQPANDPHFTDWRVLTPAGRKRNEKNWMPWVDGSALRFVYFIDPGRIVDDKAQTVHEGTPALALDHLRGGSPLLAFDGGWLTITHEVSILGGGVRRYLHRWVWFDRDGIVQRVSGAFWLLKCEYEYIGGLLWHADEKRLVMCFGRWDREAWISTVSAAEVRRMLTFMPGARSAIVTPDITTFLATETNHALRTAGAVDDAVALADASGWPLHPTRYKVWDNLLAVGHALTVPLNAVILDAGSEMNSPFLRVLHQRGFRDLTGINLLFTRPEVHDGVMYRHGDITATAFGSAVFDFIACLSVLEHGVDVAAFLGEMARIMAPGGLLFISFDYWADPVETGNRMAYRAPVYIFTRQDVEALVDDASRVGLTVVGNSDLSCEEKVVHWDGLEYTFANLLFRRGTQSLENAPTPLRSVVEGDVDLVVKDS